MALPPKAAGAITKPGLTIAYETPEAAIIASASRLVPLKAV